MRRPQSEPLASDTPAKEALGLEGEHRQLKARLAALTEEVSRNEALLRKTQERELELLRAGSLTQLFERLIGGLKSSYQLDGVSLVLNDPQHEIRHLLSGDGLEQLQGVSFVDALVTVAPQLPNLDRPWLGAFRKADHELLMPQGMRHGSLALIPLRRHEQLDGVLIFSSTDASRFTQDLASDFLAHLGVVAAICIENAVNRARLLRSGLTDFLTGFHNRRYLHARLREELASGAARPPVTGVPDDRRGPLQAHQRPARAPGRGHRAARGGAPHRCGDAHQRYRRALRRR